MAGNNYAFYTLIQYPSFFYFIGHEIVMWLSVLGIDKFMVGCQSV
jgi:hypothetical protein